MWQAIVDFLSSEDAPVIFVGLLVAIFLYALLDGWMRLSSARQEVERGNATLCSTADRTGYFQQFEQLSDQFSRQPLFANAWAEFSKTIIIDPERQLVRITRRPHMFFNERSLVAPRINLRLYAAMPGYLISLGLFFTFIGLVAAIAIASEGLGGAATVAQTQDALVQLLDVASLKFISSVAGISLSVILSFIQKAQLNRVSRSVHRFCDMLEARTQLVTTEQLLYQWLTAQEQTTRNYSHLAEDIATEVALQLNQPQAG